MYTYKCRSGELVSLLIVNLGISIYVYINAEVGDMTMCQ